MVQDLIFINLLSYIICCEVKFENETVIDVKQNVFSVFSHFFLYFSIIRAIITIYNAIICKIVVKVPKYI